MADCGVDHGQVGGSHLQAIGQLQALGLTWTVALDQRARIGAQAVAGEQGRRRHGDGTSGSARSLIGVGIGHGGVHLDGQIRQHLGLSGGRNLALAHLCQRQQTGRGDAQARVGPKECRGGRLVDVGDGPSGQVQGHSLTRHAIGLRRRRTAACARCEHGRLAGRHRERARHGEFRIQHLGHHLARELVPGQRAFELAHRRRGQCGQQHLRGARISHGNQTLHSQHAQLAAIELRAFNPGLYRTVEVLTCHEQAGQPPREQ